ncbi:TRAP transporter small permease [Wenxinia saemankumensis]|uniref:TRAP transporter small permease protein n=1 Tax=Wenxinia saemankumensis TaxID=1447782 RepID=A0A1M6A4S3_9RHOB|nr:TRAP transporter small permease [Wenxinia saemankumensis]SHI31468.1 Tripartite ATP-independent transporter, DctQ component [Wenxinia saemankumensis]
MHRAVLVLSRLMALLGGAVLCLLIAVVCLSILGRSLNGALHHAFLQSLAPGAADALIAAGIGPIRGAYELVEAGMAFAVFAFLPLAQVSRAHATVDIFTGPLPERAQRWLSAAIEVVFAAALIVIAVQLKEGMDGKIRSGQTTLLLQYPVWWSYAASLAAAGIAAGVATWMALVRVAEALRGRALVGGPA